MHNLFIIKRTLFIFCALCSCALAPAQTDERYSIYYPQANSGDPGESVVIALSGVKLRATPSFDGKVLAVIPFKETVLRKHPIFDFGEELGVPYNPPVWTPDSIRGYWEEVEWKGKTGYAFNAFLGAGIVKMTDDFYLMFEDRGDCWLDTYASTQYHYYGLFTNADTSKCTLRTIKPTFYSNWEEYSGAAVRADDKQPTVFLIASKAPLVEEGPIRTQKIDESQNLLDFVGNGATPVMARPTIPVPETPWWIEGKRLEQQGIFAGVDIWLRDKKTGQSQQLYSAESGIMWARLVWCGDLDRDGVMDFMLLTVNDADGVCTLFLSRNAGKGKLVRPACSYTFGDCC